VHPWGFFLCWQQAKQFEKYIELHFPTEELKQQNNQIY